MDKDKKNKNNFDPDQVIGNQNSVSGEVVLPTEEELAEIQAKRDKESNGKDVHEASRILKNAKDARERLNKKLNEVRDYGADARESPL
ncbi:MAG: hypothetical protein LBV74_08015 [Tannerella sp.]|jgi:hypothetical protein|nr:hypothetical protein [Tannerella sp.]